MSWTDADYRGVAAAVAELAGVARRRRWDLASHLARLYQPYIAELATRADTDRDLEAVVAAQLALSTVELVVRLRELEP